MTSWRKAKSGYKHKKSLRRTQKKKTKNDQKKRLKRNFHLQLYQKTSKPTVLKHHPSHQMWLCSTTDGTFSYQNCNQQSQPGNLSADTAAINKEMSWWSLPHTESKRHERHLTTDLHVRQLIPMGFTTLTCNLFLKFLTDISNKFYSNYGIKQALTAGMAAIKLNRYFLKSFLLRPMIAL